MSWTQEDLDKLNKAIATGAKKVTYRDRTVEYRDLQEMLEIRRDVEVSVGSIKRASRITMSTSTGL